MSEENKSKWSSLQNKSYLNGAVIVVKCRNSKQVREFRGVSTINALNSVYSV